MQQRFGRDNIGYLWVVAEPMMMASVITLLDAAVSKRSPFAFMLTGYSIYIIFRNSFNRAESSLHRSDNLFYHGLWPRHSQFSGWRYIRQAAVVCVRLVLALYANASVKRLKGPSRPVQPEAARAEVIGDTGRW